MANCTILLVVCLVRIKGTYFRLTTYTFFSFLSVGENIFNIPFVFTNYLLSLIYQNDKEMKKTINYNGKNIKVNFETANHTRVVDRMDGIRIADAHGTKDFIINGKTFQVEWTMKYKKTHSVQLHFEGFTCGDSEKKMIEHIISKYGL